MQVETVDGDCHSAKANRNSSTDSTPGISLKRSRNSRKKSPSRSPLYRVRVGSTPKFRTLFASNPGSMLFRFSSVCTSKPAPTSTTTVSATCATTRALPELSQPRPAWPELEDLPPSFKAGVRSTRIERNAGARPNKIPVRIEAPAVKASTRRSISAENPVGREDVLVRKPATRARSRTPSQCPATRRRPRS